ncbi:hypothetical protein EDD93_3651 [Streptomyces sp. 840.1]|uniref:hypothetical protein n=1 Tax=Streptomyces sp. 840.1 TaxID=2485152 RepID=UPI000FAE3E00|nr:hypothetical protein [Streptomyces sp. 840.1]ROQ69154.1 hypothetical protein EDD93_3651 [Streptomyces sp. 840.1]
MICDHCDQLMRPDEAEPIPMYAATGAGTTIYVHKVPCTKSRAHPVSYPTRRA